MHYFIFFILSLKFKILKIIANDHFIKLELIFRYLIPFKMAIYY